MNIHVGATWTDERIEHLRGLVADRLTASQIADAMGGISRNSVIGKAHRLGISLGKSSRLPPQPRRRRRTKTPHLALTKETRQRTTINPRRNGGVGGPIAVIECETLDLPPDQSEFACTIAELTPTSCRWPLGSPAHDMPYCGAEHDGPGPYCVRHHILAYKPATRRA